MAYDFNTVHPNRNTQSLVYDRLEELGLPGEDIVPFSVAEMLFAPLPAVQAGLQRAVENGYYGYRIDERPFFNAVSGWLSRRHGVAVNHEQLVPSHGVVTAIGNCIRAFTNKGDAVVIQPPVYNPFVEEIRANGRRPVENPLVLRDGRFEMDLVDLEAKLAATGAKLMVLCSPHNPVGRVWTRAELSALQAACARLGVMVVADEIHQDIVLPGHTHIPYALLGDGAQSITLSAPSKTFNIAGLSVAYAYSRSMETVEKFRAAALINSGEFLNPLGEAACTAAYEEGEGWLAEFMEVLEGNAAYLRGFLKWRIPGLVMAPLEGTYLAWVDCRCLEKTEQELKTLFLEGARMDVNFGGVYGKEGEGFVRINLACPRKPLEMALSRLEKAVLASVSHI